MFWNQNTKGYCIKKPSSKDEGFCGERGSMLEHLEGILMEIGKIKDT